MNYLLRNPKFYPATNTAKYPFSIHFTELVPGARVIEGRNPNNLQENLADPYGMNIAFSILNTRWQH